MQHFWRQSILFRLAGHRGCTFCIIRGKRKGFCTLQKLKMRHGCSSFCFRTWYLDIFRSKNACFLQDHRCFLMRNSDIILLRSAGLCVPGIFLEGDLVQKIRERLCAKMLCRIRGLLRSAERPFTEMHCIDLRVRLLATCKDIFYWVSCMILHRDFVQILYRHLLQRYLALYRDHSERSRM